MKKRFLIFISIIGTHALSVFGQGETYNWCFGDSAYVKYAGGVMTVQNYSAVQSMEVNTSISDKNGNILFYTSGISQAENYLKVFNSINQLMVNGDSLLGYTSSTNGVIIVPFPQDTNKYYIFSTWYPPLTFDNFLYMHTIDISLNSGNGELTQKNVLLLNQQLSEKLSLVRHGNGRDWWLIAHSLNNSDFYIYLIDLTGIQSPIIQSIGSSYHFSPPPMVGVSGEMVVSSDGSKICTAGPLMINYFNFNRCTGVLSNFQDLTPTNPLSPDDDYYGCSFSPNDSVLYVSNWSSLLNSLPPTQGVLCQFDLTAPNIKATRQNIFSFLNSTIAFGQHEVAPDGKNYITTFYNSFPNYTFDSTTMYLSTIENPNILGLGCNFQLYSFYLGGHRALAGLPNMPNYNIGALMGSPCDTLTYISESGNLSYKLSILYPNPNNGKMNYEFYWKDWTLGKLIIYDMRGKEVGNYLLHRKPTVEINLNNLSEGLYLYRVFTDTGQEKDKGKLVIVK